MNLSLGDGVIDQDISKVKPSTVTSTQVVNETAKTLFMSIRLKLESRKQQHAINPVIDLDTYQVSCAENITKWWIEDLHLLDLDKSLLTSGAWINAGIINACQVVLSRQFNLDLCFQDVGCRLRVLLFKYCTMVTDIIG